MTRCFRFLMGSLFAVLASTGVAYAQEEGAEEAAVEGGEVAAEGGEAAAVEEAVEAEPEAGGGGAYPTDVSQRPLVLPKGMTQANLIIGHLRLKVLDTTATATFLNLGATYGVADKIEAGISLGMGLDPEVSFTKALGLHAGYLVKDTAKLDVAAQLTTGLSFEEGADVFSGFKLGGYTRYSLNEKMYVTGGNDLLAITTAPGMAGNLHINAGFGYQASPKLNIELGTNLLNLGLFGDTKAPTTSIRDALAVNLRALFVVSDKIDAGLWLSVPDVANAADLMVITVGGTYRI